MRGVLLQVLGQVDDHDGFEGAFLESEASTLGEPPFLAPGAQLPQLEAGAVRWRCSEAYLDADAAANAELFREKGYLGAWVHLDAQLACAALASACAHCGA